MTNLILKELNILKAHVADIHKLLFNVDAKAPQEELTKRLRAEILMKPMKIRKQR